MKENNKEVYIERFKMFWEAYPKGRKVAKPKCQDFFIKKKVSEELLNQMLTTLEKYKKTKQWQTIQYIPHPMTWLNQGRWEDEVLDEHQLTTNKKPLTAQEQMKILQRMAKQKSDKIEKDIRHGKK